MAENETFPLPSADALKVSQQLVTCIRQKITAAHGSISFSDYMACVLYEPSLGYYSAGSTKIGAAGDFVTAPEISSVFSQALANQCIEVLHGIDQGSVLEFGAGTGRMAADILLHMESQAALPPAYYILELSSDLRERQQNNIKQRAPLLFDRVVWLDALPESFSGVMLANEVLDAMPVELLTKVNGQLKSRQVAFEQHFFWQDIRAADELVSTVKKLESDLGFVFPDGYLIEINRQVAPWLDAIYASMKNGVVLLIDYGYSRKEYFHPQRHMGTLLCHYRHRVHDDVFYFPGLQDITASVEFTAVAEHAAAAGFEVLGFSDQASFLIGCGLEQLCAERMGEKDQLKLLKMSQEIKTLTLPSEMGERFKVMGLAKNTKINAGKSPEKKLAGFSVNNQLHKL